MWKMEFCRSSFSEEPTVEMTFESPEAWREWLAENEQGLLRPRVFKIDGPRYKQHGTDSCWSSLRFVDDPDDPSEWADGEVVDVRHCLPATTDDEQRLVSVEYLSERD